MNPQQQFESWAKEINTEWSREYSAALLSQYVLTVFLGNSKIGEIDYSHGRYTVASDDEDVKSQLEYMVNR